MSDISLVQKSDGSYDWDVSTGDLSHGDDLASAVMISMLTDGLADDTHTTIAFNRRRGWWGSYLLIGYFGFQAWTCFEEAVDTTTLQNKLINYTTQALTWLVTEGTVKNIDVTVTLTGHLKAIIQITLTEPDENQKSYAIFWKNI